RRGYDHAKELIAEGRVVLDERDDWSEHQPNAAHENAFLEQNGWREYAKWYLAIDDEASERTKGHYKFPYGDFENVHRCGVLTVESRAGTRKQADLQSGDGQQHRN